MSPRNWLKISSNDVTFNYYRFIIYIYFTESVLILMAMTLNNIYKYKYVLDILDKFLKCFIRLWWGFVIY